LRSGDTVELRQVRPLGETLGRASNQIGKFMSLDEKAHAALKTLIDTGLVREVHTQRHAQHVEGGPVPDEVNVSAVLDASEPDKHRTEIERLLQTAGFGQVVLRLQGETTLSKPTEEASEQERDDVAVEDDRSTRERAHRLWDAEGRPEGRNDEYWHRAEELIADESQSSYPPSQSRGNRT